MKLIFLDIDGVLNSDTTYKAWRLMPANTRSLRDLIAPKMVANLNKITDASGAGLVISSSWRMDLAFKDPNELVKLLKECGVTGSIVGETPHSWEKSLRHEEITAFLQVFADHSELSGIAVIDDCFEGKGMSEFVGYKEHLIMPNVRHGLQQKHINQALRTLNKPLPKQIMVLGSKPPHGVSN